MCNELLPVSRIQIIRRRAIEISTEHSLRFALVEGYPADALAGSVVVFTGALGMSRIEATTLAAQAGMCVRAGVTKHTTHQVVGDQDLTVLAGHDKSTKHRKAAEMQAAGHPIRIIGTGVFRALVARLQTH